MTGPPVIIIENNEQFFKNYNSLNEHSIVNCRLRLIPGEEHLLTDLLERRIRLIPSATSQLASRSKAYQARIFSELMLPNTLTVYDSNGLLKATSYYTKHGITEVVVKRDRKNGGIGIHRFKSVEDVYNQLSFGTLDCPVVLQPFIEKFKDIRVIWLGEYIEAYERINSTNFRHNLHCGGSARQFELTEELLEFCKKVMRRGCFPYAHIDLMQTPSEEFYLTEVNLRGGLRGAKITGNTYRKLIDSLHTKLLAEVRYGDGTPER